ncbi:MAG: TolC family protein [Planctomycetes bacterium]|nr:TolC family protein [Planctomycetota bacterium]
MRDGDMRDGDMRDGDFRNEDRSLDGFIIRRNQIAGQDKREDRGDDVNEVTLDELISIALRESPKIALAAARLDAARAEIGRASSAFVPSVTLFSTMRRTNTPGEAFVYMLNQHEISPTTNFNRPGWMTNFRNGVSIQVPLYVGGTMSANLDAAVNFEQAGRHQMLAVKQSIAYAAAEIYFRYFEVSRTSEIVASRLAALESAHNRAKALAEEGLLLEADAQRIEVRVLELEQASVSVRESKNRLMNALMLLLGRTGGSLQLRAPAIGVDDILSSFDFLTSRSDRGDAESLAHPADGEAEELTEEEWKEMAAEIDFSERISIERLVQSAIENREELDALKYRILALEDQRRAADGRDAIHVYADGAINIDDRTSHLDYGSRSFTGGVSVMWDILAFAGAEADEQAVGAQIRETVGASREMLANVVREVRDGASAVAETESALKNAVRASAAARSSADVVRARFEEQLATTSDLLLSDAALFSAEMNREIAFWELKIALLNLRRAQGLLR